MSVTLSGRSLTVVAGGRNILDGVHIDVSAGHVTAIIGPNGAGKSTLLKVLSGDITPQTGRVTMNGRLLNDWSAEERALQRAVLPQTPELAFSFRTRDVVELGRHPHRGRLSREEDRQAVAGAMLATETATLAERDCKTLSGGELHRAHYARVLAQIWSPLPESRARILLLDEPTASLDLFHQHAILAKAREIAGQGAAVVAVLHDLNLAATYADTLVAMASGRIDGAGSAVETLTEERLFRVWRVNSEITQLEDGAVQVFIKSRSGGPIPLIGSTSGKSIG
jgi:iron complex transport system ATP-binding protein